MTAIIAIAAVLMLYLLARLVMAFDWWLIQKVAREGCEDEYGTQKGCGYCSGRNCPKGIAVPNWPVRIGQGARR